MARLLKVADHTLPGRVRTAPAHLPEMTEKRMFGSTAYMLRGKSTTRFLRPGYVAKIKNALVAYKRFRKLPQDWVSLAITLSQMKLEEAR